MLTDPFPSEAARKDPEGYARVQVWGAQSMRLRHWFHRGGFCGHCLNRWPCPPSVVADRRLALYRNILAVSAGTEMLPMVVSINGLPPRSAYTGGEVTPVLSNSY